MSTFKSAKTAISFQKGSYPSNTPGIEISFPQVDLHSVLIAVSQSKKIVKTDVYGRDGKIKEFIGLDDYNVTVSGTITGENGVQPLNSILDLKKTLDARCPISVVCPFLNNLGIFYLVNETYELPQEAGGISYQTFTLNFTSDIPANLVISNA